MSLNPLRNSELVAKKTEVFFAKMSAQKFREARKLIPFVFEDANMSSKMPKRAASIFVKLTTACKCREQNSAF